MVLYVCSPIRLHGVDRNNSVCVRVCECVYIYVCVCVCACVCVGHYVRCVKVEAAHFNRLTPNDPYMGRTAPLTSKRCILYIYSTNIGIEYFKHAL